MSALYNFTQLPAKKIIAGVSILALMQLFSCTKDTGNYTYHDINDIIIGLPDLVVVDRNKTTVVDPQIRYTLDTVSADESNYKFEWHIQTGTYDYDTAADFTTPVLTVTPASDFFTDKGTGVSPAVVSCNLVVTDKRTGLFTRKNFKIAIHTTTNFGWSLLCEKSGQAVLGMLSYATDGNYESYPDVLASIGKPGFNLQGQPHHILQSALWNGLSNEYINIISAGQQIFAATTFDLSPVKAQFYSASFPFVDPSAGDPVHLKRMGGGSIALFARQDQRLYGVIPFSSYLGPFIFGYAPTPLNNYNVLSASSNPESMYNCEYYYGYGNIPGNVQRLVLFNEDTHRFHMLQTYPIAEADLAPVGGPDLTGFQLRYLNGIYHEENSEATLYALFSESATNDMYVLVFEDNGILKSWKKVPGLKDGQFNNITLRPVSGQMIYNTGSKVYSYDHSAGRSTLLLDVNDERISTMRFHEFNTSFGVPETDTWRKYYKSLAEKLVICTYKENDPDHSGTFTMYDVSPSGQQLVVDKSYGGMGKIVDFTFNQLFN